MAYQIVSAALLGLVSIWWSAKDGLNLAFKTLYGFIALWGAAQALLAFRG